MVVQDLATIHSILSEEGSLKGWCLGESWAVWSSKQLGRLVKYSGFSRNMMLDGYRFGIAPRAWGSWGFRDGSSWDESSISSSMDGGCWISCFLGDEHELLHGFHPSSNDDGESSGEEGAVQLLKLDLGYDFWRGGSLNQFESEHVQPFWCKELSRFKETLYIYITIYVCIYI